MNQDDINGYRWTKMQGDRTPVHHNLVVYQRKLGWEFLKEYGATHKIPKRIGTDLGLT